MRVDTGISQISGEPPPWIYLPLFIKSTQTRGDVRVPFNGR